MEPTKGIKTTEFWLSIAAVIVAALLGSGLLPAEGWLIKVVGMAATVLTALGYTGARMVLKNSATKAAALAAVSGEKPNP